jgi:hypothetical protein
MRSSLRMAVRRSSADGPFRPFVESYYFREPSIAMLMTELAPDKSIFEGQTDLNGGD